MDFKTQQVEAMSAWFTCGDARVKFRSKAESEKIKAIHDEFVTTGYEFVRNTESGKMERVTWDEPASPEVIIAFASELISEWENVEIDGEPAECTVENKRRIMSGSQEFMDFCNESIIALTDQVKKEFGSDEPSKNSKRMRGKK